MYIRYSVRRKKEGEGKDTGGKSRWNCDNSDYFFKVEQSVNF